MNAAPLHERVAAWIADDPEPADREELTRLLVDPAARAELAERFSGRLRFGTAGLRGAVGAGPNRMNRAVVRATTAALARWLLDHDRAAGERGVVVGCDARQRSEELQEETARVLAGAGIPARVLEPRQPTPLLAFAVRHLGAAAGVMITASHNPPADNGYKLYLGDGAQIVPPVDAEIEAGIAGVGPLSRVAVGAADHPLVQPAPPGVADAYLDAIATLSPAPPGAGGLRVVHTALHGVSGALFARALERAGYPPPIPVALQAQPDPSFPTVAFPNPEEPGALDLALAAARDAGADIVIANDPDGDRLAVAVPDGAATGGWRVLRGDELGVLLGAHLLDRTAGDPDAGARLVATTVVSSTLLARVAAAAGSRYAETLTGFKWIARAAEASPGSRFLYGYEEALGYAVGEVVRDKDGIGAALAVLGMAVELRTAGRDLPGRLDDLEAAFGVHATEQVALHLGGAGPAAAMESLRGDLPEHLGGSPVLRCEDLRAGGRREGPGGVSVLPPADLLVFWLDGARVVVRPSGTEPKLKIYLEAVLPAGGTRRNLPGDRAEASRRLRSLRAALVERLAPPVR